KMTNENRSAMISLLPLLMYATSLFMNNLTVILLFCNMALYLSMDYHLPVIPVLVSMVIGSNIGGASLPWADTPAVILTLYTDFNLLDFLSKLFLPCLFFALFLSIYTFIWYKYFSPKKRVVPFKDRPIVHWKRLKPILTVFVLYLVSISIGPFVNLSIAYISLFFGGIALFLNRKDPADLLNTIPVMDSIAFIIALFLIGGVLEYSGILMLISKYIVGFTNNNSYIIALSILFLAFIIAIFLSAGPATATLLPICTELSHLVPFNLIYASLALGILAGSSMLPWSATGGPIMFSETNRFIKKPHQHLREDQKRHIHEIFSLRTYLYFSIPFSLIMLGLSALYIVIYIRIL
ncbi:MAG: hypothetical protein SA378_05090, partial [Sedimentibacter sp.]|uniref:SLC13 family permease n=1 Tax=Sedimentibacter sp. TaxID=1960295 RepID=UPI0029818269